jgi:translation initiation factor 4E
MFKDGVKPMWEDDFNINGGKVSLKLRKDFTTIIWEEMILAVIGSVLSEKIRKALNGVVVSIRKEYNVLQVWFNNYEENVKEVE